MRKALVVGINYYPHLSHLSGCVDDAHAVKQVLERHSDASINFSVKLFTGTSSSDVVDRGTLKDAVEDLFSGSSDISLFYFAGHGSVERSGGYLLTSDSRRADDGLALSEVMRFANHSEARNKIILLDSCHSGFAGVSESSSDFSTLSEGMTILTAATEEQYAVETRRGGLFTSLMVDALNGAAANLVGDITPGSVYAHIDQSLGPWEQRPVFKTNVQNFVSLRKVQAPIAFTDLRKLTDLFPSAGYEFALDPSYEPTSQSAVRENCEKFALLQKFNRVNLVVANSNNPHMYYAAMESKSCKLTVVGEHYRRLLESNLL